MKFRKYYSLKFILWEKSFSSIWYRVFILNLEFDIKLIAFWIFWHFYPTPDCIRSKEMDISINHKWNVHEIRYNALKSIRRVCTMYSYMSRSTWDGFDDNGRLMRMRPFFYCRIGCHTVIHRLRRWNTDQIPVPVASCRTHQHDRFKGNTGVRISSVSDFFRE